MRKAVFDSRAVMDTKGLTNGLVQIEPLDLFWRPDEKEWSANQRSVIDQGDLFADKGAKAEIARRVPWQFRLKYRELSTGVEGEGKILQWSLYQGYLQFLGDSGSEDVVLKTVADRLASSIFHAERTVFTIFGIHGRFGRWMISALYHLPTKLVRTKDDSQRRFAW